MKIYDLYIRKTSGPGGWSRLVSGATLVDLQVRWGFTVDLDRTRLRSEVRGNMASSSPKAPWVNLEAVALEVLA